MTTARLSLLFRLDAVANVAIGVAALGLLAAPDLLGLPRFVLAIVGVAALANAVDLARTARQPVPEPAAVRRAAAVDVVFAAPLLAIAVVGLSGQGDAARWILAIVADVSLVVAACKLLGLRTLRLAPA